MPNAARVSGEFGCDLALDTTDPGWPDAVKKATGGKGVDVIVDLVSASVANGNLAAAAILGRIVNVGRLGGMKGEFDFDLHALKRIDYIGVTFRTRTLDEVRDINRAMRADLWGGGRGRHLHVADPSHLSAGGHRRGAGDDAGQPRISARSALIFLKCAVVFAIPAGLHHAFSPSHSCPLLVAQQLVYFCL